MASINGVEIKNLKQFSGHEGEPLCQGTIYLNGRKLGFWSQDAHGGDDNFEFDAEMLEKPFFQAKSVRKDDYYQLVGVGAFIADIVLLSEIEKDYKRMVKKGFPILYVAMIEGLGCYTCMGLKTLIGLSEEDKNKLMESLRPYATNGYKIQLKMYKGLEDFIQIVGNEKGYKEIKEKEKAKREKMMQKYQNEEKKRKEEFDKLMNNGRYTVQQANAEMIITDIRTKKSLNVPLYEYKDILKALVYFNS